MRGEREILECAKRIRDYCSNCTVVDCLSGKCIFSGAKKCVLEDEPVNWRLKGDNNDDYGVFKSI